MKEMKMLLFAGLCVFSFMVMAATSGKMWNPEMQLVAWMLQPQYYWPVILTSAPLFVLFAWCYHRTAIRK